MNALHAAGISAVKAGALSWSQVHSFTRFLIVSVAWYTEHRVETRPTVFTDAQHAAVLSCAGPLENLRMRLRSSRPGGIASAAGHEALCAAFGARSATDFWAQQEAAAGVIGQVLLDLEADVVRHGCSASPLGSEGEESRLALLPHVLLALFLCCGGLLDFPHWLELGETVLLRRAPLSGVLHFEVMPPWLHTRPLAPRRLLLDAQAQQLLRWLVIRLPDACVAMPNLFCGLSWRSEREEGS